MQFKSTQVVNAFPPLRGRPGGRLCFGRDQKTENAHPNLCFVFEILGSSFSIEGVSFSSASFSKLPTLRLAGPRTGLIHLHSIGFVLSFPVFSWQGDHDSEILGVNCLLGAKVAKFYSVGNFCKFSQLYGAISKLA